MFRLALTLAAASLVPLSPAVHADTLVSDCVIRAFGYSVTPHPLGVQYDNIDVGGATAVCTEVPAGAYAEITFKFQYLTSTGTWGNFTTCPEESAYFWEEGGHIVAEITDTCQRPVTSPAWGTQHRGYATITTSDGEFEHDVTPVSWQG